ncbi:CoA pyrophosphatase [Lysobacter solisilvae]|uniref:CoA pyrophosphatase n=1 Tax=Agrilutibacter solisilvae TaxID=2763317 RepID=A0A974Y3S3_9GAMM|nr:CoA pyrophosphatase [Lysobacter solisilvae]QSX77296.1 CoA pyrophosphatase [Lysobacter solisilvae]
MTRHPFPDSQAAGEASRSGPSPTFADTLVRLRAGLHPLDRPPVAAGWNQSELIDLLPSSVRLVEAAVLVGLIDRPDGVQVLLTRRTDDLRNHAGQVSFPGGRVEASDFDATATALRETFEEVGVAPVQVEPMGLLDPLVTISGFRVLPVVAIVDPAYVARPDPSEVAEVFEVPLAFLLDPGNLQRHEIEHRGRARTVLEFRWPAQRIWGVTAAILLNFRERVAQVTDARG